MPSVLLVDYNRLCMVVHEHLLESCGFTITRAKHGQEAVDLISAGYEFDAVILNLNTPAGCRLDGLATTRILKSMNVKSLLVGISLSNELQRESSVFMEAGLDACYSAPLNTARIGRIIQLVVNHSSSSN